MDIFTAMSSTITTSTGSSNMSTNHHEIRLLNHILQHMCILLAGANSIKVWPINKRQARKTLSQHLPKEITSDHLHALFWKLYLFKNSQLSQG